MKLINKSMAYRVKRISAPIQVIIVEDFVNYETFEQVDFSLSFAYRANSLEGKKSKLTKPAYALRVCCKLCMDWNCGRQFSRCV